MSAETIALVVVSSLWVGGAAIAALVERKGQRLDTAMTVLAWPLLLFGSVLVALAEFGFVWGGKAPLEHVAQRSPGWHWKSLIGTRRWTVALVWKPAPEPQGDSE